MKPVHALWAALAATLALASCGGGSSSTNSNTGNAGPVPTAAELALLPLSVATPSQFIAPLDTATLKRSAPAGAQGLAVSRLPAGASVARVSLGALPASACRTAARWLDEP
jgi:hypothetical protein